MERLKTKVAIKLWLSSCRVPVLLVRFNRTGFFSVDFGNPAPSITFQENPSIGNLVVPCVRTMTKLTDAFRDFANAPKMLQSAKNLTNSLK